LISKFGLETGTNVRVQQTYGHVVASSPD